MLHLFLFLFFKSMHLFIFIYNKHQPCNAQVQVLVTLKNQNNFIYLTSIILVSLTHYLSKLSRFRPSLDGQRTPPPRRDAMAIVPFGPSSSLASFVPCPFLSSLTSSFLGGLYIILQCIFLPNSDPSRFRPSLGGRRAPDTARRKLSLLSHLF